MSLAKYNEYLVDTGGLVLKHQGIRIYSVKYESGRFQLITD